MTMGILLYWYVSFILVTIIVAKTRSDSLKPIKGTTFISFTLTLIFILTADNNFIYTFNEMKEIWGLNNQSPITLSWVMQYFTNSYIHLNIEHLIVNISLLVLTIHYEKVAGVGNYLIVFIICNLAASLSIFVYQQPVLLLGASGGVFGLLAATFVEGKLKVIKNNYLFSSKVKGKKYLLMMIISFVVISVLIEIESKALINHVGHFIGMLTGMIYVALFPSGSDEQINREPYIKIVK